MNGIRQTGPKPTDRVVIVGAGIGGLAAGFELAASGLHVTVVERTATVGGKLRRVSVGGRQVDAGPTVLTMRWVFERLLSDFGFALDDHLKMMPAELIARHAWSADERLDLFADQQQSADSIGELCGPREADNFRSFAKISRKLFEALRPTFMEASQPTVFGLASRMARVDVGSLFLISPGATLWQVLCSTFQDPRLRQLFGRYATYCGSSPFSAQATLMLIAHVEQEGVWTVDGGMHAVAEMLARLAEEKGATFHMGRHVDHVRVENGRPSAVVLDSGQSLPADHVILNCDAGAVARGLLGEDLRHAVAPINANDRSLSAVTYAALTRTSGFPLSHHNVFFSTDYRAEFDDIERHKRLPREPTVYVCAQDRGCSDAGTPTKDAEGRERALILVNAPAIGDGPGPDVSELARCWEATTATMERCGLKLEQETMECVQTTPADFHQMFPGTGGALYGRNSHGWAAAFRRPGNRTAIPGLYLCGGSAHPGPGVPMATLSGRLAAASLKADLASIRRFRPAVTCGGTLTR